MPRNQRQQLEDQAPLLYSSLTTRRSSYPTWVLVVSSPFPHVIEKLNKVAHLLLSSNHAFDASPYVDDIAAAMPWLLESAPIPLSYCYKSIAINLCFVCDIHGDNHIPLSEAHLKILQVCFTVLLHCFIEAPYGNVLKHHIGSGYLYFSIAGRTYGISFK
jgi:hypothetical protein